MLRLVILSVLGPLAVLAGESVDMNMMHKLNKYNLLANCYGHEQMTEWSLKQYKAVEFCKSIQSPMFSGPAAGIKPFPAINAEQINALRGLLNNPALSSLLGGAGNAQQNQRWEQVWGQFLNRNKRAAEGLLEVTEEDKEEFMQDMMDFKESMMTKLANLSCVLTQMEMLDGAGEINMDFFSYDSFSKIMSKSPAGQDSGFVRKMSDSFSDCYDISRAWPQKSLDRHPLTKKHGRHMIFFECSKKAEMMNCVKFQMHQYIEMYYGQHDDKEMEKMDMPGDKYDKAMMAVKVMMHAATPEEKFVDDFFWGKNKM